MPDVPEHTRLTDSWDRNAGLWRDAVRDGLIASRKAVTNRAVVDAALALRPRRVLDMGCGEGWLVRALADRLQRLDGQDRDGQERDGQERDGWGGSALVGADGSAALIDAARQASGPGGGGPTYLLLEYEDFTRDPSRSGGPFDLIVFNFSLLDDRVAAVLTAASHVLATEGAILVQTLHPRTACGDAPYADGWRIERFDGLSNGPWQPMPWYYRTMESWMAAVAEAGLAPVQHREPLDPATGKPASLLLLLRPAG